MQNDQPAPERIEKPAQIAREAGEGEKLLTFHVYRSSIWNTPADPRWCVASVWDGRAGSHQCSRKPKHQYGGHGWCAQHYPPNEHKRRAEADAAMRAKWKAEDDAAAAARAAKDLHARALKAIQQIAAGHNDPRGLALEVLGNPLKDPAHG